MKSERILRVILFLILFAVFCVFVFKMNRAVPVGGIDEGRLFLAGATSFLQGEGFPITQRTPVYSLFLAFFGKLCGVNVSDTILGAHEYGNIGNEEVARDFLKPPFQRVLLIAQIIIWLATGFLLFRSLRILNVSSNWATFFLILYTGTTWILATYIYDPVLTAFFLTAGVYGFIRWIQTPEKSTWIWIAGAALAISALTRATFQVLIPCLLLPCFPLMRKGLFGVSKKAANHFAIAFIAMWLVFVGAYSVRNYFTHGFFGVSSATGLSLSGRAALFLEKAQPEYPEEVAEFLKIREIRGNTLGARSIKWLMSQRGMTWPEANNLLTRVSLLAIKRAPIRYLTEVGKSMFTFHMPSAQKGDRKILIFLYMLDSFLIVLFLLGSMIWISFHLLGLLSPIVRSSWSSLDSIILFCEIIYWYCAFISSGIDYGRPEHRTSVLFIMPFLVVLIANRFQIWNSVLVRRFQPVKASA
jgi:hypothetical protein